LTAAIGKIVHMTHSQSLSSLDFLFATVHPSTCYINLISLHVWFSLTTNKPDSIISSLISKILLDPLMLYSIKDRNTDFKLHFNFILLPHWKQRQQ